MRIQACTSINELNRGRRCQALPNSILTKNLVLKCPDAIRDHDYYLFYNEQTKWLYLRYLNVETSMEFDYWRMIDVGQLVFGSGNTLIGKVANLKENQQLYFYVAAPEESYLRYYPLPATENTETTEWDERIKALFIPSTDFINKCSNSKDEVLTRLKPYFKQYTDLMNGEHFIVVTDSYDLNSTSELIEASGSVEYGGVIGYEFATNELRNFLIPDFRDKK